MFSDPIVRCRECQALLSIKYDVKVMGKCYKCGDNRSKKVLNLSNEEMQNLEEALGYDHNFLMCFDPIVREGELMWIRNYEEVHDE